MVLCEADAARHPKFAEYKRKFWELPTEYGHDYEAACFLRWVAMAVWGGGMMVDYDVINYGFAPQLPHKDKMFLIADRSRPLFMGSILAPGVLFQAMSDLFYEWQPDERDWNPNAKLFHCSDLIYMQQCFEAKNRPCPPWLFWENGCTVYPKIDGQLVHYGYDMRRDGHWPKHQYIEKIRPF